MIHETSVRLRTILLLYLHCHTIGIIIMTVIHCNPLRHISTAASSSSSSSSSSICNTMDVVDGASFTGTVRSKPWSYPSNHSPKRRPLPSHLPLRTTPRCATATTGPVVDVEPLPAPNQQSQPQQHLVLIGGGHAHIQVIKALHRAARPTDMTITLIDAVSSASYSGMVPGCISGFYSISDTQLQLPPLAAWSDIAFLHDTVIDIDFLQKRIYVQKNPTRPISFDVVSIDIGSTSRGYNDTICPGVTQYAIPTRPIDQLICRMETARQEQQHQQQQLMLLLPNKNNDDTTAVSLTQLPLRRLVVIGGGVAGIELSMSISSRWERDGVPFHECVILDANSMHGLLPNENDTTRDMVQSILQSKNIVIRNGCIVSKIDEHYIYVSSTTDGNSKIPYTHCIWSTGAGAHALSWHLHKVRGLQCDENGWICVLPTLQSRSYPYVFAAGDCATIQHPDHLYPSPPKAGVYAVRSGPILIENLTRYLESIHRSQKNRNDNNANNNNNNNIQDSERIAGNKQVPSDLTLRPYIPQNDFLKLLVCGDGTALGFRFGLVMRGKWVFQLKDSIDRKFMNLFDVSGVPKPKIAREDDEATVVPYDTRQYDSALNSSGVLELPNPVAAATLLQRTDDNVDFELARNILSKMGNDPSYRDAVVRYIQQPELLHAPLLPCEVQK
jgi:NADH dehydrogenase FAD-containing subunit